MVAICAQTSLSAGAARRSSPGAARRPNGLVGRRSALGPLDGAKGRAIGGTGSAAMRGMLQGWWSGPARAGRSDSFLDVSCASAPEKMTVAVTGATGLVGSRLVAKLSAQGHEVRVLTRNVSGAKAKLQYRGLSFYGTSDWEKAIVGCTGVVNLAGEPIATRWTPELKKSIKSSRITTTQNIASYINNAPEDQRPTALVSASAVGFYGVSETQTFNEDSKSGDDYLAEVCIAWEDAAKAADVRTVILRIGVVLAPEGGALAKMLPVFSIFAGGPLGSGSQWFSWVHRDDLVALILEGLTNQQMQGVYNATAPKPVRMSEMCSALGGVMGRPSWLPVPEFALKSLLGEGASVVLDGQRVLPSRAQAEGFNFQYSELGTALRNIMR